MDQRHSSRQQISTILTLFDGLCSLFDLRAEVLELADPAAYLPEETSEESSADSSADSSSVPARTVPAHTKLDLLLGTQGWRRFVYQDPLAFLKDSSSSSSSSSSGSARQNISQQKKQVCCHYHHRDL
jgi:hypothetical protein